MQKPTACPSDETLMDFLEHRLSGTVRQQVERHLTLCSRCREQAAVCAGLLLDEPGGETVSVPSRMTQRAVDAVLALDRGNGLRRLHQGARQWMTKGAETLERLVWQPTPAGVAVRGSGADLGPEVIRRKKQFGDLQVAVEIERYGAGQALIRVEGGTGPSAEPPVRVALYLKDREAASSVLGREAVVFEEIPPGVYTLVFARQGCKLGEYAFEIVDQT